MGQLNYDKGVQINPPRVVFKTIAENIALIDGTTASRFDFNKLKVSSRLVNAIQYFNIEGLIEYSFAYIFGEEVYFFKVKEQMTEAIRTLLEGRSIDNSFHIKFLRVTLNREESEV